MATQQTNQPFLPLAHEQVRIAFMRTRATFELTREQHPQAPQEGSLLRQLNAVVETLYQAARDGKADVEIGPVSSAGQSDKVFDATGMSDHTRAAFEDLQSLIVALEDAGMRVTGETANAIRSFRLRENSVEARSRENLVVDHMIEAAKRQAEDRTHRNGQQRPVTVTIASNTVDSALASRVREKVAAADGRKLLGTEANDQQQFVILHKSGLYYAGRDAVGERIWSADYKEASPYNDEASAQGTADGMHMQGVRVIPAMKMLDSVVVSLPDGFNGHTAKFYIEPLEVSGNTVKLRCAEPGKEYMFTWREKSVVDAAVAAQLNSRKLPEVLQLVRTDMDNCRAYYKHGDTLYAFQRERRDHFQLYECTPAGEPMVPVPMKTIDRRPDDYPEFERWVDLENVRSFAEAETMSVAGNVPEHEYAFDCTLTAAIRVKGTSREAAEANLRAAMDAADCNAGAWPNGDPILFEASVNDSVLALYEMDGESVVDGNSPRPGPREIRLHAYDIVVTLPEQGGGAIKSSLHNDDEGPEAKAALDGLESMILAHAVAGIDVNSPAYLEGIETAVEAIWNQYGDEHVSDQRHDSASPRM
ncbi:hypothetical protein [Burkholderia vietnamiensis]|uniref:hypothetical protein n=1 Tax=Burkholderia vietnamiensis TaxID=60552 RepID=UPI00076C9363|nr:hypothetical protein [Burkholderia vietnamiensis]KVR89512.1 hypothetical protein WK28_24180 [Burkholderia vietnamiensis]MBR8205321.1 hypothetical protein [Burkholderia vietnamiensis]